MGRVRKYDIPITSYTVLAIPEGAEIINVELYQEEPDEGVALWAIVNPYNTDVEREFAVIRTGQTTPGADDSEYIGSAIGEEEEVHVFEFTGG